ncbi:hypothetical protein Ddye_001961 [Dipteronia dyeriana]|uniref:Uncharacterized protein n=1 Tax=Dipteronia dyeriana TaxID=168575 RepID=A0AAE0CTZ4_9ROSI|nr:hypothetical protein Ddye_001961 [Dipteronia dyeriana]
MGVGVGNIQFLDSLLEIKDILLRLMLKALVCYVARSGNAVADFLTKKGVASGQNQMAWVRSGTVVGLEESLSLHIRLLERVITVSPEKMT